MTTTIREALDGVPSWIWNSTDEDDAAFAERACLTLGLDPDMTVEELQRLVAK